MTLRLSLAGACAALALGAGTVVAQNPAPFPEFEAKRIKPPTSGSRNRINIQIDPAEQIARAAPRAKTEVDADEGVDDLVQAAISTSSGNLGRYAWFWDKVSPALTQSGPGRLDAALQVLNGSGAVATPRLQALQDIARVQGISILRSTIGTEVSPALVLAVIIVESSGRADAESPAGAQGLMQLMPATASRFGVENSLEPEENIAGGVRYLDWLMKKFDGDPILVLAGYNAGAGSVRDHEGVPPYSETRDYVPKVLAAFQVAKGLCATPPELISDGCVFTVMN